MPRQADREREAAQKLLAEKIAIAESSGLQEPTAELGLAKEDEARGHSYQKLILEFNELSSTHRVLKEDFDLKVSELAAVTLIASKRGQQLAVSQTLSIEHDDLRQVHHAAVEDLKRKLSEETEKYKLLFVAHNKDSADLLALRAKLGTICSIYADQADTALNHLDVLVQTLSNWKDAAHTKQLELEAFTREKNILLRNQDVLASKIAQLTIDFTEQQAKTNNLLNLNADLQLENKNLNMSHKSVLGERDDLNACVRAFSSEKDGLEAQLKESNTQMKELTALNAKLISENQSLLSAHETRPFEVGDRARKLSLQHLLPAQSKLLSQKAKLKQMESEFAQLQQQNQELSKVNQALMTERDELFNHHTNLASTHDSLAGDHTALSKHHQKLADHHENLAQDHETLSSKHEVLAAEHNNINAEFKKVLSSHESLASHSKVLSGTLESTRAELETALLKIDFISQENRLLSTKFRVSESEKSRVQEELKMLTELHTTLEVDSVTQNIHLVFTSNQLFCLFMSLVG